MAAKKKYYLTIPPAIQAIYKIDWPTWKIAQNNQINDALGHNLIVGFAQSFCRIVCRHDNNN